MNISDLLTDISKPKMILSVSGSCHQVKAKKILNDIICENPEFADSVYALSILKSLIWADEERKKYKAVIEDILILAKPVDEYRDINSERAREIESAIIALLKSSVASIKGPEGDCIRAVHGFSEAVSDYIMTNHYKNAVKELSKRQSDAIDTLLDALREELCYLTDEGRIAYHDIDILFSLSREAALNVKARPSEKDILKDLILLTGALKSYNSEGAELQYIAKSFLEGQTEEFISNELSKSRNYVRKRYKGAKDALAVLLFGLTTKETVTWIFKE